MKKLVRRSIAFLPQTVNHRALSKKDILLVSLPILAMAFNLPRAGMALPRLRECELMFGITTTLSKKKESGSLSAKGVAKR
jgi:hypothetical protein